MKYLRMFADETGESHFEYAELNSNQVPFMPPAPPVHVSDGQSVDNLVFYASSKWLVRQWSPCALKAMGDGFER